MWRSYRGTGATIHDIRRTDDGRLEFTVWLSVVWIPIIPISSWSAVYIGELPSDGVFDDAPSFADLVRIPHDWMGILQTLARGILILLIAIAPATYMIYRVQGRGANRVEMIFVFASAGWPVLIIILAERWRRAQLRGF